MVIINKINLPKHKFSFKEYLNKKDQDNFKILSPSENCYCENKKERKEWMNSRDFKTYSSPKKCGFNIQVEYFYSFFGLLYVCLLQHFLQIGLNG